MAHLKSHGKELFRRQLEEETPNDQLISWHRITRTYHSDGKVLQKVDVRFRPSDYRPDPLGELYSYGWKVFGSLKKDRTPQQAVDNIVAAMKTNGSKWTVVPGGPAPFIMDMDAVMRAAQRDEMVGFCRECGEEHHNIEPDARNYRCESCGAMAVYGAEELLIGA